MGTPPPAGWFTSPDSDGMQRWWDGTSWTAFTRPTPSAVPTPRAEPTLPADPAEQVEKATEALAAMQQQGGLMGAFATVASQALQSQLAPPVPAGPGLQPYGRPEFGTSSDDDEGGTSISWRVGPFSGGRDPDDRYGNRRRPARGGPVSELVVGLVFLVVGLVASMMFTGGNIKHADESTVTATVVDHRTHVDSDGTRLCSPVASFSVGGTTYTAGSHISSSSGCPAIGASVTVIYTTGAPGDGDARVQSTDAMLWIVWIFPVVGLVLVILAVRRLAVPRRAVRLLRGE